MLFTILNLEFRGVWGKNSSTTVVPTILYLLFYTSLQDLLIYYSSYFMDLT